jgi:hypothetical protein
MMKKTLFATVAALLLIGCGGTTEVTESAPCDPVEASAPAAPVVGIKACTRDLQSTNCFDPLRGAFYTCPSGIAPEVERDCTANRGPIFGPDAGPTKWVIGYCCPNLGLPP